MGTVEIFPQRTAIGRSKFSAPARLLDDLGLVKPNTGLLYDMGCGRGTDVDWWESREVSAIGHDPYLRPENPPETITETVRYITCFYVLNVIPRQNERATLIRRILDLMMRQSTPVEAYFVSRGWESDLGGAVRDNWIPYGDGYVTPKGTFQTGIDANRLRGMIVDVLVSEAGFYTVDSIEVVTAARFPMVRVSRGVVNV